MAWRMQVALAIVFEVHDPQLERRVALKVMKRRLAARSDQRRRRTVGMAQLPLPDRQRLAGASHGTAALD